VFGLFFDLKVGLAFGLAAELDNFYLLFINKSDWQLTICTSLYKMQGNVMWQLSILSKIRYYAPEK
jgi:hypothetical protein